MTDAQIRALAFTDTQIQAMEAQRAELRTRIEALEDDAVLDKAELSRIRPHRGDPYAHSTIEEWGAQVEENSRNRQRIEALESELAQAASAACRCAALMIEVKRMFFGRYPVTPRTEGQVLYEQIEEALATAEPCAHAAELAEAKRQGGDMLLMAIRLQDELAEARKLCWEWAIRIDSDNKLRHIYDGNEAGLWSCIECEAYEQNRGARDIHHLQNCQLGVTDELRAEAAKAGKP
jgi:hypothetical protein